MLASEISRSTIKMMKNNVTKRNFCWQILMEDTYVYQRVSYGRYIFIPESKSLIT